MQCVFMEMRYSTSLQYEKNDHKSWPFFRLQHIRSRHIMTALLEGVFAEAVAADGEARHVGGCLLAEVFIDVDLGEVLA